MDCKRETIDIPTDLHRRLLDTAEVRRCSVHDLILEGIEGVVLPPAPKEPVRRLSLDSPIVPSRDRKINLTNDKIHELLGFS